MLALHQQFQEGVFKAAVFVIKKKVTTFYWNDYFQFPNMISFLFLLL